ncbi:hypothetical protein H0H81_009337 [Sphagnurus paluster]|uniref:Uncharacterized protein n=1 Tax=Sphagnurus paluster TaxID=117069 RepID=A0A9P7FKS3_9AGAR|nr:hypothetical protein H0H81_009337 [Sphagnurus paluster]
MDIMQTRAVDTHSGDSTASHESIGVPASPDEEWVQLGIDLEERQLTLQDQARRLQKEPREEDEKKIDNERHLLGVQLAKFLAARPYVAANGVIINIDSSENPPECFDDFDNDGTTPGDLSLVNDGNTAVSVSPGIGDISPEYSILPLPSRMQGGSASLAVVELRLRILQAQR